MLKANVGLSRKLSKDYQSTGFSVNLEGELTASPTDYEVLVQQIGELYDLAQEALDQQIQRSQSEDAIASRDALAERQEPATIGHTQKPKPNGTNGQRTNGQPGNDAPATDKQIKFLLSIGKRQRLSTSDLEAKIADVLGYSVGVYDLSKPQAGVVLDALANGSGQRTSSRS